MHKLSQIAGEKQKAKQSATLASLSVMLRKNNKNLTYSLQTDTIITIGGLPIALVARMREQKYR